MGVMQAADVSRSDTLGDRLTRAIPASLSPILAELELESARVVTIVELAALVKHAGVRTEARVVADRLRRLGWLLPTATAGVWEFAPGSHAGESGMATSRPGPPRSSLDRCDWLGAVADALPDLIDGTPPQMSMLSLRVAPGRFGFVLRTSSTVSRPR